jgi:hypothetical protein
MAQLENRVKIQVMVVAACAVPALIGCREKATPPPPPPVPVVASEVMVRDQPIYLENIGQSLGAQDVQIRARVEGVLESMHFSEGSFVKSNDLLYVIDPVPWRRAWSRPRASLAQTEALLDKARRDVSRLQPLWEKNAISRQTLDDALAAERSAKAGVDSARAALDTTQIQLGYASIVRSHGRPGGQDRSPARQPGGPRGKHPAHHHVQHRPHPLPLQRKRKGLPGMAAPTARMMMSPGRTPPVSSNSILADGTVHRPPGQRGLRRPQRGPHHRHPAH